MVEALNIQRQPRGRLRSSHPLKKAFMLNGRVFI